MDLGTVVNYVYYGLLNYFFPAFIFLMFFAPVCIYLEPYFCKVFYSRKTTATVARAETVQKRVNYEKKLQEEYDEKKAILKKEQQLKRAEELGVSGTGEATDTAGQKSGYKDGTTAEKAPLSRSELRARRRAAKTYDFPPEPAAAAAACTDPNG